MNVSIWPSLGFAARMAGDLIDDGEILGRAHGAVGAFEIIKGTGSPKNFKYEGEDGGLG
jgi:hypothetical protein